MDVDQQKIETPPKPPEKKKKKGSSRSIETLFRSAYRTQLELTGIADAKANIMISVNGLIITGIIATAGLFVGYGGVFKFLPLLVLAISVTSMVCAVLAAKPKLTQSGASADAIKSGDASLLYFANFGVITEDEYAQSISTLIEDIEDIYAEMSKHIFNLGSILTQKYRYLTYSYSVFLYGMVAISLLFSLVFLKQSFSEAGTLEELETNSFSAIYEPSGLIHTGNGEFLVVEDEPTRPVHRIQLKPDGRIREMGHIQITGEHLGAPLLLNDLEGITSDGNFIYLITSHSQNKSGNAGRGRLALVRYQYDQGKLFAPRQIHDLKEALINWLSPEMPFLSAEDLWTSINLEGLSWSPQSKSLVIGFRAPVVNGKSLVMHIGEPGKLFEQQSAKGMNANMSWLDLNNQGIRSLSWDDKLNGYFIVTGRKGLGHELWKWSGQNEAVATRITTQTEALPQGTEGLSTVQLNGKRSMLVVIDDGNEELDLPGHYKLIPMTLSESTKS